MDKQETPTPLADVRRLFSIDAVRKRFRSLKCAPVRGDYGTGLQNSERQWRDYQTEGMPQACLLGSFEHMAALREERNPTQHLNTYSEALTIAGVDNRTLRLLEAGWEDDFSHVIPTNEDEVQVYELGVALGNLFVGKSFGEDPGPKWEAKLDQRLKKAGIA